MRVARVDRLARVHQRRAALVDDALDVGDGDVLVAGAERDQQVEAGERRGAGAGGDDLGRGERLAGEGHGVGHRGGDDDRRAVLVVVENRDLHALAQGALDLEALGRLDVLEVDAAEGRLQRRDHLDQLLRVFGVDLDVEDVDAGEALEEHGLALHHRLRGERADVAEPEHGGAVREHGDEVLADRHLVRLRPGRSTIARQAAATPGE